jgi:serine/threonine protein kinase
MADVHQAYPKGIHPKDMAWMWRRILDALGYAHSRGIVHGAVLPNHVWLFADAHEVVLADWHAAVDRNSKTDAYVSVIDEPYRGWYPQEVFAKKPPTGATDIHMSAAVMVQLLGGDPTSLHGRWPASVPPQIRGFLLSCMLPHPSQRPQNAWRLMDEFTTLVEQLWGPRKFRPFHMPAQPRP